MDAIRETEQKGITAWPNKISKGFFHVFRTITGRMNADGNIFPINDPVLVHKEAVTTTHTNVNQVVVAQLDEMLGVPLADLKNFYVDVYPATVEAGVSATDDDLAYKMDVAALNDWIHSITIQDFNAETAARAERPWVRLFPDSTHGTLTVEALDWTTGTEYHRSILMIYRMPDSICVA